MQGSCEQRAADVPGSLWGGEVQSMLQLALPTALVLPKGSGLYPLSEINLIPPSYLSPPPPPFSFISALKGGQTKQVCN